MAQFFIGIDGGGTSCRAALADADGNVLGQGRSGAANILTDVDGAVRHIVEATGDAFCAADLDPSKLSGAATLLGLAGANVETTVATAREKLPFAQCAIETDALIAAHGALAERDGAVAILGTGSVFTQKRGDQARTIGGWGFVVGDQGAGAALGRSLLREALLAHDGVRSGSEAMRRVLADFDNDPRRLSAFAQSAVPGDFARYAPQVFELAAAEDPVAMLVLKTAAAEVDEALDVVLEGESDRLCLLGGIGRLYKPWLAARHGSRAAEPAADALAGATWLAVKRFSNGGQAHG